MLQTFFLFASQASSHYLVPPFSQTLELAKLLVVAYVLHYRASLVACKDALFESGCEAPSLLAPATILSFESLPYYISSVKNSPPSASSASGLQLVLHFSHPFLCQGRALPCYYHNVHQGHFYCYKIIHSEAKSKLQLELSWVITSRMQQKYLLRYCSHSHPV